MLMTYGLVLLAFLSGSIPFGLLIARSKGIDIRNHGSGNIGATNVLRIVGKKQGCLCFALDFLKGLLPTLLGLHLIQIGAEPHPSAFIEPLTDFAQVYPASKQFTAQSWQVLVGLFAILGHNYTPWAKFRGGKGIATTGGVFFAFMPFVLLLVILIWTILFFATRYVSIASIGASVLLPFTVLFVSWLDGRFVQGTWNKPLFICAMAAGLLATWKHRSNIRSLINGTEHRFTKKTK